MKSYAIAIMFILLGVVVNADLSEFPSVLAKDGTFNAQMIVGENAGPEDFITAVNFGLALQQNLQASGECESEPVISSENVLMKETNNMVEGGESISIVSPITENEFSAFAPEEFSNDQGSFDYEQYLHIGENITPSLAVADGVPRDEAEIPKTYLIFEEDAMAYEYRLVFPSNLESKIEGTTLDLQNEKIELFGQEFSMVEALLENNQSVSLTFLADSNELFINEYESKTYTINGIEYDIKVNAIYTSDGEEEILIQVNDESDTLKEGESFEMEDGPVINVKNLFLQSSDADMALLSVGPQKIEIKDSDITDDSYDTINYYQGSEEVEGTAVKIEGSVESDILKLESINVKWTPEQDHFVEGGQGLSDVVEDPNQLFLNGFDIFYKGTPEDTIMETITLTPVDDKEYTFGFMNKLDEQLDIPLFYDNLSRFGNEDYSVVATEGAPIQVNDHFLVTSDGYKTIPEATGYTHLVEYKDQDAGDNVLTFLDKGSGKEIEVSYSDGETTSSLMLKNKEYTISFTDVDDGPITVDLDNDGTITPGSKPVLVTKYGLNIDLVTDYVVKGDPLDPTTWINYSHRQLAIHSKKKEGNLAGDQLNQALYHQIGPAVRANLNSTIPTLAGAGILPADPYSTFAITENPVTTEEALTTMHDSVRLTVEEKDDYLEIQNVERCIDGANKKQIVDAVTDDYDALLNPIGISLDETVYSAFMDNACYPTFTTSKEFMLDVGETDNEQGAVPYGQISSLMGADESDSYMLLSADEQVEHLVYVRSAEGKEQALETSPECESMDVAMPDVVLDKNYNSGSGNLILFGGPCVNSISKEIIGSGSCTAEFEQGKGRLKLVDYKGKKALMVAGYSAEDTKRAARSLLEYESNSFPANDVQVTSGKVSEYEIPDKPEQPQEPEEPQEPKEPEEPEEPELNCAGTAQESGEYHLTISKFGVKKEVNPNPAVDVDGTTATVSFKGGETFESQYGVDWLQYVVHVMKDNCNGEEVETLTFRWEDGDKDKEQTVELPEEGCYCLKVDDSDVTIDSADISMEEGQFTLDFSTG